MLIIQARMGSTRLPGKSLMDLAGAPLVGRILERVKRCGKLDQIVLATPDTSENDRLATLADEYEVTSFRGSEDDLVDRYYRAATAAGAAIVLRLPADNPVPEPAEIDRIVDFHRKGTYEFSSNLAEVLGSGYPDGIGAEAIDFDSLEAVWKTATDPRCREHVHLNFFDYDRQEPTEPGKYAVGTPECPEAFRRPDLVLDVNTVEQYEFMRILYEYLYSRNPAFHITDVIAWYDKVYRA